MLAVPGRDEVHSALTEIHTLGRAAPKDWTEAASLIDRLYQLANRTAPKLSDTELMLELQRSFDRRFASGRTWIPGGSPDWTPRNAYELAEDYVHHAKEDHFLRQVIGNLSSNVEANRDNLREFLRRGTAFSPKIVDRTRAVTDSCWDASIFRELEKRLSACLPLTPGRSCAFLETAKNILGG